VPEFAALGALEPLQARVDASAVVREDDYFPGIWDTNVIDGALYGVPWYVDTRLLFYRKDLLAQAGFAQPPVDWDEWRRALAAIKANAGTGQYAIFLPLNEFEPLLGLALQQADPLLRDRGTRGNFESPGFRRALEFYLEMFQARLGAAHEQHADLERLGRVHARPVRVLHHRALADRRVQAPPAEGRWKDVGARRRCRDPTVQGAGRRGGSSFVVFRGSQARRSRVGACGFLSAVPQQRRFYALTGDLPARRSAWDDPVLAGDEFARAFRDQLERAKPTPKVPEWERIANEMQLMAERVIRAGRRRGAPAPVRRGDRRDPREAARAPGAEVLVNRVRAGYAFVAPALG
jgi:multiple sugar transport system substrate-binding protein